MLLLGTTKIFNFIQENIWQPQTVIEAKMKVFFPLECSKAL